jgi:hypothetical protein
MKHRSKGFAILMVCALVLEQVSIAMASAQLNATPGGVAASPSPVATPVPNAGGADLVLPAAFLGCWKGTVPKPDSVQPLADPHLVEHFGSAPTTYVFCYQPSAGGPNRVEMRDVTLGDSRLDNFTSDTEIVAADAAQGFGELHTSLHATHTFRLLRLVPIRLQLDSVADELCYLKDENSILVQGHQRTKLDGKDWTDERWHALFHRVAEPFSPPGPGGTAAP